MEELEKYRQAMIDNAEKARIKAGNDIMNYITEYFLEIQKIYRDEYEINYIEAMRQDKIWEIDTDEFKKLMEEYFELTVG